MTAISIRQPLRMLLLPAMAGTESAGGDALQRELLALGVRPEDFLNWVSLRLQEWRANEQPHRQLVRVARAVILASCAGASTDVQAQGGRLAERYFKLHERLRKQHLMKHEEAVAFLSHAFLIAYLAFSERLSAAQIANLLTQRDRRAKFSRQAVANILAAMGIEPSLSQTRVESLFDSDASGELVEFADASLDVAAEIVAEIGEKLGFPGDLLAALRVLMPTERGGAIASQFTPYLQMLHYQCCVAEYFDHALTDVYEFSPRGEATRWLIRKYPNSIAGAANPFLNNAKSVEILDLSWVRTKKNKERPGAMALFTLLEGMQAMGFFARRELAWWVRLWLVRIIRLASLRPIELPGSLSPEQTQRLLDCVRGGNTASFGIIEQRVVDAIASVVHVGWRVRGVGDAVNATNISRAKLGDCDFLDPRTATLLAYESHGGELSSVYVDEHVATLHKAILRRVEELNAVADLGDWTVTITFVAHSVVGPIPREAVVHDVPIQISTCTFREFLDLHAPEATPAIVEAINNFVLTPFRERRTPNEARRQLMAIIGL
ncbi:hypothetical protein [Paraburkholderia bannensis]|uniref:hypothetical protein n=1 Tax=Paraburkholderia bannensis TaxID=765414 RepID=UPI002AC37016|nr:hypothetical protein [Paraburkholderia bannensis]